MVDRQKLPALEYVMAQLPRHGVGVEVHSGGGLKRGNVDVFQVGWATPQVGVLHFMYLRVCQVC